MIRTESNYQAKWFRIFFILSLLTLFFFLFSFGPIFYKAITDPDPPHTDNGLGMAYAVFALPVTLSVLLLLVSACFLFLSKRKPEMNTAGFVVTAILAIPVFVFGLLMFIATLISLKRFF
jgi:uncharacterized BrkB/YihY/UPF0761 family membrane protein